MGVISTKTLVNIANGTAIAVISNIPRVMFSKYAIASCIDTNENEITTTAFITNYEGTIGAIYMPYYIDKTIKAGTNITVSFEYITSD